MRYFLTLFIGFSFLCEAYVHNLSICAIFQNESPYLKEWIEYHLLLGVDHFYLYNNNSTDNFKEVLEPYIQEGRVVLIEWPSPPSEFWGPFQKRAYNDCIIKVRNQTKWLAIIDIDEFIVVTNGKTLPEVLPEYEEFGGVFLFWQMFGTSDLWDIPEGQTQIESLVYKAQKDYSPNYNCKTICRPDRVKSYSVHDAAHYLPPYYSVNVNFERSQKQILLDPMHINHYWTRTKNYFFEFKNPRHIRVEGQVYTPERAAKIFTDLHQIKDETILLWLPTLRERLK